MLNVGIIGCGEISDYHRKAWKAAGARVVALCDKNVKLAEYKAREWRVPRYYEDIFQMIGEEKLNIVSICTPAKVRLQVVKPIIENGIHVVIEKPFATSVHEAEKMVELKNQYGIKLTVVHNWLFSHVMEKTLSCLEKKEIGDILRFEMDLLNTKDDSMAADSSHWCHSLQAGRFGEMLSHPLYIVRAILGEIKINNIYGSKMGNYQWMPIDELTISLEGIKKKKASIYASFNTVRRENTIKIIGTTGILEVNLSNNIFIKKQHREIKIYSIIIDNLNYLKNYLSSCTSIGVAILTKKYQNMHTEFFKEFINSINSDVEPPVSAEEALEVTKLHEELSSLIHKEYF